MQNYTELSELSQISKNVTKTSKTANSDYTVALRAYEEYQTDKQRFGLSFISWLKQRLNAEKYRHSDLDSAKREHSCKEFLPGSKKCPIGNKTQCGERSCLLPE